MLDTKNAAKWPLTTQNGFDGKKLVVKGHFTCGGAPTGSTRLVLRLWPLHPLGLPGSLLRWLYLIFVLRPGGALFVVQKGGDYPSFLRIKKAPPSGRTLNTSIPQPSQQPGEPKGCNDYHQTKVSHCPRGYPQKTAVYNRSNEPGEPKGCNN